MLDSATCDDLKAEWNAEGQCYLVPVGVVVNPLTKEEKLTKSVVCPRCNPVQFAILGGHRTPQPPALPIEIERAEGGFICEPTNTPEQRRRLQVKGKLASQVGKAPVPPALPDPGVHKGARGKLASCGSPYYLQVEGAAAVPGGQRRPSKRSLSPRGGSSRDLTNVPYPLDFSEHEKAVGLNNATRVGVVRDLTSFASDPKCERLSLQNFMDYCIAHCGLSHAVALRSWNVMTARGKETATEAPIEAVVAEFGHQLESGLKSAFITSCFAHGDPSKCGYIRRADVLGPREVGSLTPAQHACLAHLFRDNPSIHEISYPGFCVWLGTDTELLSTFAGCMFAMMKKQTSIMAGLSWLRFKRAL